MCSEKIGFAAIVLLCSVAGCVPPPRTVTSTPTPAPRLRSAIAVTAGCFRVEKITQTISEIETGKAIRVYLPDATDTTTPVRLSYKAGQGKQLDVVIPAPDSVFEINPEYHEQMDSESGRRAMRTDLRVRSAPIPPFDAARDSNTASFTPLSASKAPLVWRIKEGEYPLGKPVAIGDIRQKPVMLTVGYR